MSLKKGYYIRVQNSLVEVTYEVYLNFYRTLRQERTQREKEQRNHVISYDAWDTRDHAGQDLLSSPDNNNVEDAAIAAVMSEKLHHCISLLPWPEQEIIKEIYFDTKCEKEVAEKRGVPLTTLRYRRDGILRKLKKMMNS